MKITVLILILMIAVPALCEESPQKQSTPQTEITSPQKKVVFIELGSVKCIPCKMMKAVMDSVEHKYSSQVEIIFYDVWTPEGKPYGEKYGIKAIPTQIFLDAQGKEYHRHTGYYPLDEVVKILQQQGVK